MIDGGVDAKLVTSWSISQAKMLINRVLKRSNKKTLEAGKLKNQVHIL